MIALSNEYTDCSLLKASLSAEVFLFYGRQGKTHVCLAIWHLYCVINTSGMVELDSEFNWV